MTDKVTEQLPLTETTLFILLSLAPNPKHGYAIMKEVAELSEGRVRLSTGTLYGALARLLERNWIERIADDDVNSTERGRKEYGLTEQGRQVLLREIQRMKTLVAIAQLRAVKG
jgi:DNA-binding PadR family transcriptional regulator